MSISKEAFIDVNDLVGIWQRAEDVPSGLREIMLVECNKDDYFTPLHDGKKKLFEGLCRYQPRTGKLLMDAGPLLLRAIHMENYPKDYTAKWLLNFGLEVKGQMVMVERLFHGRNLNDPEYKKRDPISLEWSLPTALREAYYTNFSGMNLPESPVVSVFGRFLPKNINNWALWDQYLGQFRGYKKKYIPWLEERLPLVKPSKPSKYGYFDFRCFLESLPDEKTGEVDYLWVKSFHEDGTVYHIRGKDVENMRILTEPAEAVDRYCEHVLLRKPGSFDFLEFTSEL
jgi:hypothetical protein